MRIVELILDETQEMMGIEAISIVNSPAIEADFVALKSEEIKLAELKNGNQNNSTLEHKHDLNGLSLVESWIVEDTDMDKSKKYGFNVPVGTWMGSVKVNNDEVWNEYVKTGKVKGFSIEGYFADKMERPKESLALTKEQKLINKIKDILQS